MGHLWVVLHNGLEGDVCVRISDLGDGIKLGSQNQDVLFIKLELSIAVGLVGRSLLGREGAGLSELVLFRGLQFTKTTASECNSKKKRKKKERRKKEKKEKKVKDSHLSQHLLDKALVNIGCFQGQRIRGVDSLRIRRWVGRGFVDSEQVFFKIK